jgi:hypothetical protein
MRKFYKSNFSNFCAEVKKETKSKNIFSGFKNIFKRTFNREDLSYNKEAFIKLRVRHLEIINS